MNQAETNTSVRLAVFDFDGTMVHAQSGTQFTIFLLKHHLISLFNVARVILWGARYTIHLPHNQLLVRRYLTKGFVGMPIHKAEKIMAQFHDERLVSRYNKGAIEQVKKCKEKGCICVLVSATFYGIAKAAAQYCGFDAVLATKMVVDEQGNITRDVEGLVIEGLQKPIVLREWADKKYGAGNWRVEYAYGDHHTDRELLAVAENPVCVNPGAALKKTAKKYGWPVAEWY